MPSGRPRLLVQVVVRCAVATEDLGNRACGHRAAACPGGGDELAGLTQDAQDLPKRLFAVGEVGEREAAHDDVELGAGEGRRARVAKTKIQVWRGLRAISSIPAEASMATTDAPLAAAARAIVPVPVARSSSRMPGRASASSTTRSTAPISVRSSSLAYAHARRSYDCRQATPSLKAGVTAASRRGRRATSRIRLVSSRAR